MNAKQPPNQNEVDQPNRETGQVDHIVLLPIDEPLVIDAIRCRLRQDVDEFGVQHSIPANELRAILDIVDAARACVREWQPNATEKARGAGTGVGMRAAEDVLIMKVKAKLW